MMMRRSPLLRMAAIGGVAYMGSKAGANRAAQNQAQQAQGQQPDAQAAPAPAAPPPPPPGGATAPATDRISQLKELASLHDSGALTQEEFDKEKARILA
jgi:hypothetical protein